MINSFAQRISEAMFPLSYSILSKPVILFFHGVIEEKHEDLRVQSNQIRLDEFDSIIKFLKKYYSLLSLDELAFFLSEKRKLPKKTVVLAFDDGYQNTSTVAEPVLSGYGIPFSVFINTKYINEGTRLPSYYAKVGVLYTDRKTINLSCYPQKIEINDLNSRYSLLDKLLSEMKSMSNRNVNCTITELRKLLPSELWEELDSKFKSERLLTWEEIKALGKKGVVIGSHGHDHCILHKNQIKDEIQYQVQTSKKVIESNLKTRCLYFCYPNGREQDISYDAVCMLKRAGYILALTSINGTINKPLSPFLLSRCSPRYKGVHLLPFVSIRYDYQLKKSQRKILSRKSQNSYIHAQSYINVRYVIERFYSFLYWLLAITRKVFLKGYSARYYSNQRLRKYLKYFEGDVINVSGWEDYDREGDYYRRYFGKNVRYTISNIYGQKGMPKIRESGINWIYLDLEEKLDPNLIKKFDVVFCHTVLEHIFEIETAMDNIANMTRDVLIFIVPFSQHVHYTQTYSDYLRFTPHFLKRFFYSRGFSTLFVDSNDNPFDDVYITYIASLHPEKHAVFYNAMRHFDTRIRPSKFGKIEKKTGQGLDLN
jgi:peptidoglycan/xylan/chitin deacetylase (PgdA/CDA1 family)